MYQSTKVIPLGSCAFRQPQATSHCKFIHGYRLKAKFWFNATSLDENNWVVDFGGLKKLKTDLENIFDHTTCVSLKDPEIESFRELHRKGIVDLRELQGVGIEKFAEICWTLANIEMLARFNEKERKVWCSRVEVWEHEDNSAIFERTPHFANSNTN